MVSAHQEFAAAALAHLAVGAQIFKEWDDAEALASQAVQIARARAQADVEKGALEILDAVSTRTDALPQASPGQHSRIHLIEQRMLARLHERAQLRGRTVVSDPEAGGRPDAPITEGQPTGPRTDPSAG